MKSALANLMDVGQLRSASSIDSAGIADVPFALDRGRQLAYRSVYRFGDFAVLPELYEVRARDQPVALAPKVFDLPLCLIENRDRVVTHACLRATVWRGVAVTDASLTYAVMAARRVLGDTGSTQAIIRNVRGRGYRFVAALKDVDGCPVDDPRS